MPYATATDLEARVAAACGINPDAVAVALADAEAQIELERYGDRAVRAHVMLTAHYLALGGFIPGEEGESGLVNKAKIGEIEAGYAVAPTVADDAWLATTKYGRQFLQIRATLVSFPGVG